MPGLLGRCLKVQMSVEEVVVEYWWQAPQFVSLLEVWFAVKERSSKDPVTFLV